MEETLLADCRELQRRGLLTSQQLQEYEASLASSTSDAIRERVSALLLQEADDVERVRLQRNEQEQETISNS
ncbi:Hypothetical protein PHPALM_2130, partial [Phytophthora palmivora]